VLEAQQGRVYACVFRLTGERRLPIGTYIKEFVHGDMGRTEPSLGDLLDCRADIVQLDVTEIIDNPEEDQT